MPRLHKRPSALRDSWRPVGKRSGITRQFRRLSVTLLTLLLVLALFYLLLAPFLHPNAHLVSIAAAPAGLQAVPALRTIAATPLETPVHTLATPEALDALLDSFDSRRMRSGDVVMIHIRAPGVTLDGQPYLLCENFDASVSQGGRYPIAKLLAKLKLLRASYKLLILDSGALDCDPRLGIITNEFPTQLQREVEKTNDDGLWVLHSHAELERSHLSRALGGSVFGHFVNTGLSGAADLDENRFVQLDELFRFVRGNVTAWVEERVAGSATQTPLLLFGGDSNPLRQNLTLLPIAQVSATKASDEQVASAAPANAKTETTAKPAAVSAGEPNSAANAPASAVEASESAPRLDDLPTFASDEQALAYESWQLLDQITKRQTSTSNPIDYAPHLWREYSRRLLIASSRVWENAAAATANDIQQLRQLMTGMRALLEGQPIGPAAVDVVQNIAALRLRSNIAFDDARSLGLLEVTAATNSQPLPQQLHEDLAAFDAAVAATDRTAVDEWMAKTWQHGYDKLIEFRTARRLADHPEIGWDVVKLAVRACRTGERVPADSASVIPWVRETIEAADRDRTTGLRTLFDAIGADYESVAIRHLLNATTQYQRADSQLSRFHEFVALHHDSLLLAPEYLRLYCVETSSPEIPSQRQLMQFLDALTDYTMAFRNIETVSPNSLERLAERLSGQRASLELSFRLAASDAAAHQDEPSWLAAYLSTQLPTASERVALITVARQSPAAWNDKSHVQSAAAMLPRPLTPRDWLPAAEYAELAARLAALTNLSAPAPSQTLRDKTDLRQLGESLKQQYRDLPASIESLFQRNRDLSNGQQRTVRRLRLRDADLGLRLVDPRDNRLLDAQPLVATLHAAAAYDLLAWHIARWQAARQDAPAEEARYLTDIASRYRLLAMALPSQPALPAETPPSVTIDGPSSASLVSVPLRKISLTITSRAATPQPVWLILEYDTQLIEVTIDDLAGAYREHELASLLPSLAAQRREAVEARAATLPVDQASQLLQDDMSAARAAQLAAAYPYRPDVLNLPPTMTPRAGETVKLQVTLRVKGESSRPSKLIFKAITANAYVRHAIDVPLPGGQALMLSARGNREAWSPVAGGIELHPLAGHRTEYELQLANGSASARTVDVELLALQRELRDTLPNSVLTPDELDRTLQQIQPLTSLHKIEGLVLPATGLPIPLRFRSGSAKADAGGANDAASGNMPQPPPVDAAPPPISVRHGLLLIVTDRNSQQSILRRVDFTPRRPRRYLQALASYDLRRERVSFRVTPLDPSQVPNEGFQVRCEFAEPLPPGAETQLNGVVSAPQFEALCYADVPASAGRVVTAFLHVDGYPRGFTFRVPCSKSDDSIRESSGALAVSILEPPVGQAFAAPVAGIPIRLRVDAPVGAFDRAGDVVEVGIDTDRDREFRDEATLKLFSDRQVAVNLLPLDTTGVLQFDTQVTDFQLDVPGGNLQNSRVNLLAKLQVAGRVAWSEPVEIVLDQSGPKIDRVQLFPERTAIVDSQLEVKVWSGDGLLSGVDKVLVGFDADRSGKFSDAVPPIAAVRAEGALWIANVPASGIAPGPVTLLVQATDSVGNTSEISKTKLEIVTEEEAAARRKAAVNQIVGTASYDGVPVPNTEISLAGDVSVEPVATDAAGRFVFPSVSPGKYNLKARGVARNKPRFAELADIEVRPAPAPPTRLRIELK